MAYTGSNERNASIGNPLPLLARPFVAIWNFLIMLSESGPKMEQVRKLNATTDEELAARGTSRSAEVQRIFGSYY